MHEGHSRADDLVADLPAPGIAALVTQLAHALLFMRSGDHELADAALTRAALPAGARVGMHFALDYVRGMNWLLAGPGHAEDALRWLAVAHERVPGDVDALTALGETHLLLEDPAAALESFEEAEPLARDTAYQATMLRDKAAAQRQLGWLEAGLRSARRSAHLQPEDPRNWLSLGASQLELGRNHAAVVAFRRGWRIVNVPDDEVIAAKLLLGLTKALIDAGAAEEAQEALHNRRAAMVAAGEPLIERNRAVALIRMNRHDQAVRALRRAGRDDLADGLLASRAHLASWLGFWFGAGPRRAALGVVLVLFFLPVVTRFKAFGIEVEQPEAVAPTVSGLDAASWDAVSRRAADVGAATASMGQLTVGDRSTTPERLPDVVGWSASVSAGGPPGG